MPDDTCFKHDRELPCERCHADAQLALLLTLTEKVQRAAELLREASQAARPAGMPMGLWDTVGEASIHAQRAAYQTRVLTAALKGARRHVDT